MLYLTQALARQKVTEGLQLDVVSSGVQMVESGDEISPAKATVLGLCKVVPQEHRNIVCRNIDIMVGRAKAQRSKRVLEVLRELQTEVSDRVVAYRDGGALGAAVSVDSA